ncbi:MAG: hypothetical protein ACRCSF_12490 [Mycobacteriaceae bacterium]
MRTSPKPTISPARAKRIRSSSRPASGSDWRVSARNAGTMKRKKPRTASKMKNQNPRRSVGYWRDKRAKGASPSFRESLKHFSPKRILSRVPFVVLVIGLLTAGLGLTLWLSTRAAAESYQLTDARNYNQDLSERKEALLRDVELGQSAPELAKQAATLGMIPSKNVPHLVQVADGAWVVVGTPAPANGTPAPLLNQPIPLGSAASPTVRQIQPVAVPSVTVVTPSSTVNPPQVQAQGEQLRPVSASPAPASGDR